MITRCIWKYVCKCCITWVAQKIKDTLTFFVNMLLIFVENISFPHENKRNVSQMHLYLLPIMQLYINLNEVYFSKFFIFLKFFILYQCAFCWCCIYWGHIKSSPKGWNHCFLGWIVQQCSSCTLSWTLLKQNRQNSV